MSGKPNPLYTEVFPSEDFAAAGYWFWLKSPKAHGFDVKAFDPDHIYMRSTELQWEDNRTFKRFVHDLPIAARCVSEVEPGPEIKVADTTFQYFSSCNPYKTSTVGTAVNNLDAPVQVDAGGNVGQVWTRVLHYHYNCDKRFQNCKDEEQFYLANGYGLWQWKHYRNESLIKSALMNNMESGRVAATLPCSDSYQLIGRTMNHIIASTLYLKSNGRVCSLCKGIINHRRPFRAQVKMTFTIPQWYSDLQVNLANGVTNGSSFTMDMT